MGFGLPDAIRSKRSATDFDQAFQTFHQARLTLARSPVLTYVGNVRSISDRFLNHREGSCPEYEIRVDEQRRGARVPHGRWHFESMCTGGV